MYQKAEVYPRVRRAVMVDGMSIREVSREFGLHRDTVRKMLAYSEPSGYRRQTPPKRPNPSTSSGGALHRRHRPDTGIRPSRSQEAATHRQADPRAAQGRVRIRRRIHHRQGLCTGAPPPDAGDVRAAVSCAGPRPMRLRRGLGGHGRGGAEGPLLRLGPTPQRRLFHQGLPRVERPPRLSWMATSRRLCLPGWSAPEHPLRKYQAGGGQDAGGRPA